MVVRYDFLNQNCSASWGEEFWNENCCVWNIILQIKMLLSYVRNYSACLKQDSVSMETYVDLIQEWVSFELPVFY